jgi:hypothetical protein
MNFGQDCAVNRKHSASLNSVAILGKVPHKQRSILLLNLCLFARRPGIIFCRNAVCSANVALRSVRLYVLKGPVCNPTPVLSYVILDPML